VTIQIQFLGAAGEVTGSCHLLQVENHCFLLDCGLIQGGRKGEARKLVFSGELGRSGMPVLQDPVTIEQADLVMMESTYGNRLHRGWDETHAEIKAVFNDALAKSKGNIKEWGWTAGVSSGLSECLQERLGAPVRGGAAGRGSGSLE